MLCLVPQQQFSSSSSTSSACACELQAHPVVQGVRGARLATVPKDDALQPQQLEQAQEGLEAVAAARRAHQQVVRARRQQVQQEVAACIVQPGIKLPYMPIQVCCVLRAASRVPRSNSGILRTCVIIHVVVAHDISQYPCMERTSPYVKQYSDNSRMQGRGLHPGSGAGSEPGW